jgi:EamA domain-containing membrane protein RarD
VVREQFSWTQLSGFILVWLGLVVFGLDGVHARRGPALTVIDEGAA